MAIQTRRIVEFGDGLVVWEYDWNDQSLKLVEVRCTNDSDYGTRGTLTSQSTGTSISQLVAAHSSFTHTVSQNEANQFNLSLDPLGRLLGVEHNFEWPAV